MKLIESIGKGLNDAVDYVINKNRVQAQTNRLRIVMRNEAEVINRCYAELGKYYYENLRGTGVKRNDELCQVVDDARKRMKNARDKYIKIKNGKQEENKAVLRNSDISVEVDDDDDDVIEIIDSTPEEQEDQQIIEIDFTGVSDNCCCEEAKKDSEPKKASAPVEMPLETPDEITIGTPSETSEDSGNKSCDCGDIEGIVTTEVSSSSSETEETAEEVAKETSSESSHEV